MKKYDKERMERGHKTTGRSKVGRKRRPLSRQGGGRGAGQWGRVRRWGQRAAAGLTQKLRLLVGQDLVEDMVVPLSLQLEDDTGLLQEI